MAVLLDAVPVIARSTGRQPTLVGGLAVLCRLSRPHRATSDVDTVHRRRGDDPGQVQLLIAGGATRSGPSGVLVTTESGVVQVDVLEISDADLEPLPEDPTGRLHATSHAWAYDTASLVEIRLDTRSVEIAVAEPGPIVAMKLQSMMDRGNTKKATDLLDIVSIVLDESAGAIAIAQLSAAGQTLRADCRQHVDLWFRTHRTASFSLLRGIPEGQAYLLDDMDLVADYLVAAL